MFCACRIRNKLWMILNRAFPPDMPKLNNRVCLVERAVEWKKNRESLWQASLRRNHSRRSGRRTTRSTERVLTLHIKGIKGIYKWNKEEELRCTARNYNAIVVGDYVRTHIKSWSSSPSLHRESKTLVLSLFWNS
ncbi:unnamed protein product [Lupinus luteus]|uniref:Uncharacterized protein n=1 Tax=Lupinus luteus TaxID=3873 RepID=A0AAV1YIZ1_LUPLU